MNKINFFQRIIKLLVGNKNASPQETTSHQNGSMIVKFLKMVENTDEVEIACDEVFELLDQYVELEARGEDVAHLFPLVKKHLDRCRDCHEEYEALSLIFATSS